MRSIVMSMFVGLSVCPLAYLRTETTRPNYNKFLCMLHAAVARTSFDGVAIRYVLPVSWMTPCFQTVSFTIL